jgi:hypothetical protein
MYSLLEYEKAFLYKFPVPFPVNIQTTAIYVSHTESVVKNYSAGSVEIPRVFVPVRIFHTAHLQFFHPHSVTSTFSCIMASVFINLYPTNVENWASS